MEVWLKQGMKKLRLPVLPSDYHIVSGQINTTVNINAIGEINLVGKRKLQELGFSSFFPSRYDSSYCEYHNMDEPINYVRQIEQMKQDGTVQVLITGTVINMESTIKQFEWGEEDGTGDISYTLEFKEYRKINIPSSVLAIEAGQTEAAGETRSEPEQTSTVTYEVKKGDCLSAIARRLTGSANWKPIYEQNKHIIGSNPNLIYPGQVLTIPGART